MVDKSLDGSPARSPEAVVIVVAEGDAAARASEFSRRWQAAVPRAAFLGVEIQTGLARMSASNITGRLARIAVQLSLSPAHSILLGEGAAGRVALDLFLQGNIEAFGVLAIDIPLWPLPQERQQGRPVVRLIQHQNTSDSEFEGFFALVGRLRLVASDLRYALLPPAAELTLDVIIRGGASYLVELVALASRPPSDEGSAP